MKKFFAIMMALVLVLALGVTAFASEDDDKGSITITNATVGKTYSIYKIFDAKIAVGADGKTTSVSYSITSENQFFSELFGIDGNAPNPYFVYNATTGAVTLNSDINTADEKSDMFDYLKEMVKYAETAADPFCAISKDVKFTELDYGYYLIATDNGAAVTIDSNTPDVEVIDKNQLPGGGFNKEIYDDDKEEWTNEISSNVGDVETFRIKFTATNYNGEFPVKYYTVKDVNGAALTINYDTLKVTVGDTEVTQGFTATNATEAQWFLIHMDNSDSFDIIIPWLTGYSFDGSAITYGTDLSNAEFIYKDEGSAVNVVIEYTAAVEEGADIGNDPNNEKNKNTAHLEWYYSDETGETEDKETNIFVYALGIEKIDADVPSKYLAGAEFKLYRNAECTDEVKVNAVADKLGVYVLNADGTATIKTDSSGKIAIIGLKEGTYYLKETKAPDGYNVLSAEKVEVEVGSVEGVTEIKQIHEYNANTVTVENSQGTELPSTGGKGTMMLITIGSMVAMAFAVLLITHKKMSVYHD